MNRKKQIVELMDLTSLNDDDTDRKIKELCKKATNALGTVAAVCVYPRFVQTTKAALKDSGIPVATVLNFPFGDTPAYELSSKLNLIEESGADEIDYVFPYQQYLSGSRTKAIQHAKAVFNMIPKQMRTKVILETGAFKNQELIMEAAEACADIGFDFLKTSTGKTDISATIPAVKELLKVAAKKGKGVKPSGGIRTYPEADNYLTLAEKYLGTVTKDNFRLGASSLLDNLLQDS